MREEVGQAAKRLIRRCLSERSEVGQYLWCHLVLKLSMVLERSLVGQGVQMKMNLMLHGVNFRTGTHCIALEH